jgi:hypothetical protein
MSTIQSPPFDGAALPARETQLAEILHAGDRATWLLAAASIALARTGPPEQLAAADEVLRTAGVTVPLVGTAQIMVAAQAAAAILETASLLKGGSDWSSQSDDALIAQGNASARSAAGFMKYGLPRLSGLAELLATPGAQMLDVGTGVAAMAVAFAQALPHTTVVGIDLMPRALALAAKTIANAGMNDRVILRHEDVSDLSEISRYALAWLPAPFVPQGALRDGAARVVRALVPGGWIMVGHGRYGRDPADDAVNRFKTIAFGGTALDEAGARQLLREAGIADPFVLPTEPGSPSIMVGRATQ